MPRPLKSKVPQEDFDYFDFQNWEPMSLREYEANQRKVKRNNKPTTNKLPITVPSLHLNPPIFDHDSVKIHESLTSLRPQRESIAIKRHINPVTPASSIQQRYEEDKKTSEEVFVDEIFVTVPSLHLKPPNFNLNNESVKGRYKKQTLSTQNKKSKLVEDKKPITAPSLHLKPPRFELDKKQIKENSLRYKKETSSTETTLIPTAPSSVHAIEGILIQPKTFLTPPQQSPTTKSKSQENLLKTPISFPISRQGTFIGAFPAVQNKQKYPFRRTGAKPPLPLKPFGPPPPSSSSYTVPNPFLQSSKPFPSKKPLISFPYKKAVPDEKLPTKAPFSKDLFKKHKRKSANSAPIPIPGKHSYYFCFYCISLQISFMHLKNWLRSFQQ